MQGLARRSEGAILVHPDAGAGYRYERYAPRKSIAHFFCAAGLVAAGCTSEQRIGDNLDAERLVRVGMTVSEVEDRLASPEPPWMVVSLQEWTSGEQWQMTVTPDGEEPLRLTPEGADGADSQYYAYIFFPTFTAASAATVVYFERSNETVFHVARLPCADTLAALTMGGEGAGMPVESAC